MVEFTPSAIIPPSEEFPSSALPTIFADGIEPENLIAAAIDAAEDIRDPLDGLVEKSATEVRSGSASLA